MQIRLQTAKELQVGDHWEVGLDWLPFQTKCHLRMRTWETKCWISAWQSALVRIWTGSFFGVLGRWVKCLWQFSMCTEITHKCIKMQQALHWGPNIFLTSPAQKAYGNLALKRVIVFPLLWKLYPLSLSPNLFSFNVFKMCHIHFHL